ncbi:hypothetical protein [Alistipes onderdonkii]|uniref:hypothetical protein n=1 Tax=Alistipes onderdonkii TaxID=328813 RepID=UPI0036F1FE55
MNTSQFKHITGKVRSDETATLRFSGKITEAAALCFNEEFDYVKRCFPTLIRTLINSEGGAVQHDMGVYATIRNVSPPSASTRT